MSAPQPDDPSREADPQLWRSFRQTGSSVAREQLFNYYMGFAKALARRQYNTRSHGDLELGDIFQLAYAGLLEALDRFEPERGVPFRAFAAYRISGSIRDGIAQMSEVREQISSRAQLRSERMRSLAERDSENPQNSDAMQRLSEIAVGLALGFMLEGTGLYCQSSGENDMTAATGAAYEGLAWRETVAHLEAELMTLPERERMILNHHYLGGISFENIAALMGVTKGRVSQIHKSALALLQKRMRNRGHFRLEQ